MPSSIDLLDANVWLALVEVFKVNHRKTQTAYAWSDADGKFTDVLGVPPATDPVNAVKVSIVAEAKQARKEKQ